METALFVNEYTQTNRHIHTSSIWARSNLLSLQEVGTLRALRSHTAGRQGLHSYLFFVVLEGSGTVSFDGKEACLQAGDCVFIDCRKAYTHTSDEQNPWRLAWCHFQGSSMNGLYTKYTSRGGNWFFHPKDQKVYERLLQNLYETATSESYILDVKINTILAELVELLFEETIVPEQENGKHVVENARDAFDVTAVKCYIEEHFTEELSLDSVAKALFIQKGYLCRIFKDSYGTSINTYIQQVRIAKAKGLLRFSKLSVAQIAEECGFEDANYFSRQFKKQEGMTPGEYRKQW